MTIKKFIIYFLLLVSFVTCSKKQTITVSISPNEEFQKGLNYLQSKKYNEAIEVFQNLVFNYPGTSYGADAQYYLAETYFQKKDYQSAITEFEFFINSFSGNQYLEDALYKLALCYFNITPAVGKDQAILAKSLDVLEDLLDRFPETKYKEDVAKLRKNVMERWAEKSFRIGELYYKSDEYNSARIYFDYVQEQYPNNKWANLSKYFIAQIYEKVDSLPQAIMIYESLKDDSTDLYTSELAKQKLQHLLRK